MVTVNRNDNSNDRIAMRVNISISTSVNKWFEARKRETGISRSALMAMALSEYIDQKESIKAMSRVDYFIDKIDEVKSYVNEKLVDKK